MSLRDQFGKRIVMRNSKQIEGIMETFSALESGRDSAQLSESPQEQWVNALYIRKDSGIDAWEMAAKRLYSSSPKFRPQRYDSDLEFSEAVQNRAYRSYSRIIQESERKRKRSK